VPQASNNDASKSHFVLGYRPPLDGVRGFALVMIMIFHGSLNTLHGEAIPGAFISVDMFFALSGFLITTLLAQEFLREDRIDLRAFYIRRGLRLLPALVVFLAVMLIANELGAFGEALHSVRVQSLWTALYVENWHQVWSPTLEFSLSPMTHAWTLSVEEQFYLVWPLLLWGLLSLRRSPRVTIGIVLAGAMASAALMAILGAGNTIDFHSLYGTEARAHGLLFGSALGLAAAFDLLPRTAVWWAKVIGALGALYFIAGFVLFDATDPANTRGVYFGAGLATTAIIFSAVTVSGGVLARILGSRPLVAAGRVSYGGYLWHLPVVYVLTEQRVGLSFWPLLVLRFIATFTLAVISFKIIESPALKLKRRFERRADADSQSQVVVAPGVTAAP